MNIIYAIYKENVIPLVGGVNPDGIEIGMAEYNGWKLCAMVEEEFDKYSEFKLYPIPKSIAVGMMLDNETYQSIQEDMDVMPSEIALENEQFGSSEEELKLISLSKEYIDKLELKFITRSKIRQFKDFEDDLSDTKLLIEFLLRYILEDYEMKSESEKANFPMKDLMNGLTSTINEKDIRINDSKFLNKIPKIIKDETFISRIVKSNYTEMLKKIG